MSEKNNHWYKADGTAQHTIVGKNGKERAPRIKEAMELGLYPSVTTKLGVINNFQLNDWKLREVAKYSFTYPPQPKETDDAYAGRVIEGAMEQVGDAAELGTAIHEALELHFTGAKYDEKYSVYVEPVIKWVKENGVTFEKHELRVVNKTLGYAGTTDASFKTNDGRFGIIDFKSRRTRPGEKVTPYESHIMQIAAYHHCHWGPIMADMQPNAVGCNLYISTTEPGRVEPVWYSAAELEEAWDAFVYASRLWDYFKGYKIPTT